MSKNIQKLIGTLVFFLSVLPCSGQSGQPSIVGKWYVLIFDIPGLMEISDTGLSVTNLATNEVQTLTIKIENNQLFSNNKPQFGFEMQDANTFKLWPLVNPSESFIGKRISETIVSLHGKYTMVNDKGSLKTIEFVDRKNVKLEWELKGVSTIESAEYEIKEGKLIIKPAGSAPPMILEIIGENILTDAKGIAPLNGAVFVK
jgi:hypothetical protein